MQSNFKLLIALRNNIGDMPPFTYIYKQQKRVERQ